MNIKLLGAASALALGLAISGLAAAQTANNNGTGSATNNVTSVPGLNGNSLLSGNNNSNQNNDSSNNSNQHNDQSQTNANSVGSNNSALNGNNQSNQGNDYSNNSNQNNTQTTSVFNVPTGSYNQTGSANTTNSGNTATVGSHNSFADSSNNSNQGNDYSDNTNQRNDYSNNSAQNNSTNLNVRVNLTTQDLSSNVSNISFNGNDAVGTDNRGISSGALSYSGGAFQGWAGIQTASTNSGIASNNLASTAVSANANVNFGGGNAGSQ